MPRLRSWAPIAVFAALATSVACGGRTPLRVGGGDDGDDGAGGAGGSGGSGDPETCNGIDDDGDGAVDEGLAPITCGVGACRAEAPGCVGGEPGTCMPGLPGVEACNGVDDDCDGAVDEGLGFGSVAGPHVVASVPEFAFSLALVATPEGLLLTWRDGFDGQAPTPNVFAQRLMPDGTPVPGTDVTTVLAQSVTNGPRLAPSIDRTFIATYCGRQGFDDVATSSRIDAFGAAVALHGERSPIGRSCGAADPEGIWTGQRHIFSWTDNSSGPVEGHETLLDVAREDGVSVGWRTLHDEGDLSAPPRMASSADRVVLVTGVRPAPQVSELAVHALDAAGNELAVSTWLAPEGGAWGHTPVATGASGFLVLGENRFGDGLFRMRVDAAGIAEPPEPLPGLAGTITSLAMVSRPGGGFVAVGDRSGTEIDGGLVLALDEEGAITFLWAAASEGAEPYFAFPAIAASGPRVFVAYVTEAAAGPELRVREFGCVP